MTHEDLAGLPFQGVYLGGLVRLVGAARSASRLRRGPELVAVCHESWAAP